MLWKPPALAGTTLGPGARGRDVAWLRQRLDELGEPRSTDDGAPDVYDDALSARVAAFQRRHALVADGVVGDETLVRLVITGGDPRAPRLRAPVADATPAAPTGSGATATELRGMSYILEALRKADHERQLARQRPADLARPRAGARAASPALAVARGRCARGQRRGGADRHLPHAPRDSGSGRTGGRSGGRVPMRSECGRGTRRAAGQEAVPVPEAPRPGVASPPVGTKRHAALRGHPPGGHPAADNRRRGHGVRRHRFECALRAARPAVLGPSGASCGGARPGAEYGSPSGAPRRTSPRHGVAGPRPPGGRPDQPAARPMASDATGPIASPGGRPSGLPRNRPVPRPQCSSQRLRLPERPVAAWRPRSPARSGSGAAPDTGGSCAPARRARLLRSAGRPHGVHQ